MQKSLEEILYLKHQSDTLASLYMAKYNSTLTDPELWADNFIKKFTQLADHPDILKVNKNEKENEYKVDSSSIKEFLNFLNYKPLKLSRKFVFIFNAQDLSVIVSNKLLKVLEELPPYICLFLMVPDNCSMLATVESRAIKLNLANNSALLANDSLDMSSIKSPMDLLLYLKTEGNGDEKLFIQKKLDALLTSIRPDQNSYKRLERTLLDLKSFEESADFNNSKISRLTHFFP